MDPRVRRVVDLFNRDITRELSVTEMARSVNLSPWRLCHVFKSETGTSPTRYLRSLRMEQAKTLLETTFLSVKEIVSVVGLNDESHFVRDFKRVYGFTPVHYRARHHDARREDETARPDAVALMEKAFS